jgi:hypothetical protein
MSSISTQRLLIVYSDLILQKYESFKKRFFAFPKKKPNKGSSILVWVAGEREGIF